MLTFSFDDPMLVENVKAAMNLRNTGLFSDEKIQEMYEEQVRRDKEHMQKEDDNK